MSVELEPANGTLTAVADTVLLTVPDGHTVRVYGLFTNTGATNRLVTITAAGTVIFQGDATNSPLKAGQTLEIDLKLRLNYGEEICAWQSAGADVDYFLTVAVDPA